MKAALSHPIKYLFEKIPHDSFQKIKLYALTFRRRGGGGSVQTIIVMGLLDQRIYAILNRCQIVLANCATVCPPMTEYRTILKELVRKRNDVTPTPLKCRP